MTELRLGYYTLQGGHGYASVGKELRSALTLAGAIETQKERYDWHAFLATHPPVAFLIGPNLRPDVIFHTMTEVSRLPESWVTLLNRVGLVWVPSSFCHEVFRASGVTTPIMQTRYGVRGVPKRRTLSPDGRFRVLAWGDTLFSRKDIQAVIDAFIAANLKDAELDIKLNLNQLQIPTAHWVDERGREYTNITIRHGDWSRHMLEEWFCSGDVGVYLSRGEGYGLMPKEMMASGLPMISVLHTGLLEYLNPSIILPVHSRRVPVAVPLSGSHAAQGACEYVSDNDSAVAQLCQAYHYREDLYTMGMAGAAHVLKWTWEGVGRSAFDQIQAWRMVE